MRAISCCVLGSLLPAQEQATALSELALRADVVAVATAGDSTDPSPDWHRVEFRTTAQLRGQAPATFALLEPAQRCCGRALFLVQPGVGYLLFLERRGPTLHPLGGDRGVTSADATIVDHVRALLSAAGDAAAIARLLAQGLDSPAQRVRDDAALTLPTLAELGADPLVRDRVFAALQRHSQLADTRLPALAAAAVRIDQTRAAAVLVPRYLRAQDPNTARALAAALRDVPATVIGLATAVEPLDSDSARVRAADLLATMPDAVNLSTLDRMLAGKPSPRVSLAVAEALLAHGARPDELQGRIPAVVLELAQQRRAAPPAFRAVRPRLTP